MLLPSLFVLGAAAVLSVLSLNLLATFKPIQGRLFRTTTGGVAGGGSAWYFAGYTPTIDYFAACIDGTLGVGGVIFLVSFSACMIVWGVNLVKTHRTLIV